MKGNRRTGGWLTPLIAAVLLFPVGAGAYFDRVVTSSRTLSMGGAFVAISDDPSATLLNPAGLAQAKNHAFLFSLTKPYGLSDLEESYFAAALPVKIGVVGLSWHRFSLGGVSSEDLFTIGFGRDYIRTSLDASLSFGGSIDVARVSYSADPYQDSKAKVTASLGVLLRPFPIIGIGYSVRNIGRGSFDFVPGGGGTPIKTLHTWGIAYHWEQVTFVFERQLSQNREWKSNMGLEMRVLSSLRIRSGFDGSDVTGGIGLYVSRVCVDIGVSSHEVLGTSYMVSVGYSLPGKEAAGEEKK